MFRSEIDSLARVWEDCYDRLYKDRVQYHNNYICCLSRSHESNFDLIPPWLIDRGDSLYQSLLVVRCQHHAVKMENPHAERQAVLLERILKNAVC